VTTSIAVRYINSTIDQDRGAGAAMPFFWKAIAGGPRVGGGIVNVKVGHVLIEGIRSWITSYF